MKASHSTLLSCGMILGLLCCPSALARMDGGPAATDDPNMRMYLGNIEVRGQQNITRTLQAIKVALTLPYSSDPKLANVMVCRLEDQAGSHVKQELICGTNKILSQQRGALQATMTAALAQNSPGVACTNSTCYASVLAALEPVIRSTSDHYLHTTVDGSALRGLLQQLQTPEYEAPIPVAAPAAASKQ